ncbi:MAG: anti-sigma factor family protein [Spirochaetaceae bacterium]
MYHNGEDISAYLDGELPEQAAHRLEGELEENSEARDEFARLRRLKQILQAGEEPDFESGRQRVWVNLEKRLETRPPLWRRRVSVPLPLAAAAALIMVVFAGFLVRYVGPQWGGSSAAATADGSAVEQGSREAVAPDGVSDDPAADTQIAAAGMEAEELLNWLNEKSAGAQVSVKLPDTARFRIMGEPQLVRATEWQQRGSETQNN